jgi:hypothetical protein
MERTPPLPAAVNGAVLSLQTMARQDQPMYLPPQWWLGQQSAPFPQNIVVESSADKAREQEAKLNMIMLSLFLAGGTINWEEGKITYICTPTPTQEYKNILVQSTTVHAIQVGNIHLTVFLTSPKTIKGHFSPLKKNYI